MYTEYFTAIVEELGLQSPANENEAVQLFERLVALQN